MGVLEKEKEMRLFLADLEGIVAIEELLVVEDILWMKNTSEAVKKLNGDTNIVGDNSVVKYLPWRRHPAMAWRNLRKPP